MHMQEMYDGLSAVCAVLEELEPGAPHAPALRLAQRHLHLLARLAGGHPEAGPGAPGGGSEPGVPPHCLAAPTETSHVVQ